MKRTIFIEILLLVVFALGIYFFVFSCIGCARWFGAAKIAMGYGEYVKIYYQYAYTALFNLISATIICLSALTIGIVIAIKEFPVFKPLLEKLKAYREFKKLPKAEREKIRLEEKKAKLQKQLDELN